MKYETFRVARLPRTPALLCKKQLSIQNLLLLPIKKIFLTLISITYVQRWLSAHLDTIHQRDIGQSMQETFKKQISHSSSTSNNYVHLIPVEDSNFILPHDRSSFS